MAGHYRGGKRAKELEDKGYGRYHRDLRKKWARMLKVEGWLPCTRCQKAIRDGERWDLDHDETAGDRRTYLGIAHQSCNRSEGAKNKNAKTRRLTQIAEDVLRTGDTSGIIEREW